MFIEITFSFLLGIITGIALAVLVLLFIRDNNYIKNEVKKLNQSTKKGYIVGYSDEEQSIADVYNQNKDIKIK